MSRLENSDDFLSFVAIPDHNALCLTPLSLVSSLAPNSTLLGSSPHETALVDQWLSFAATEIGPQTTLVRLLLGNIIQPYNKGVC